MTRQCLEHHHPATARSVGTGWILAIFVVLAAWAGAVSAQGGPAVQVWVQEGGNLTLTLRSDGTYTFSGPDVASSGHYATQDGRIAFQDGATGNTTVYAMEPVAQGVVMLVDPAGNRMAFRLREATGGGTPQSAGGAAAAQQPIVLVQEGMGLKLTLKPDDTYVFEGPGFRSEGPFEAMENRLLLHDARTGKVTAYGLEPGGDGTIHLVDPEGNHLAMTVRGTAGPPAGEPVPAAGSQGGQAAVPPAGTDGFLLWFLASLPSMQPDQVYQAYFGGLTETQRLVVSIKEALNAYIFQVMCMGSHAAELRYNGVTGMGEGCGAILAQAQQTAAMGGDGGYAEQQRQELMIQEKCALGLIDSGSCGTYRQVRRQTAADSARTTQTIVDNMAPPPCTRYYTPDGQFVGCW